MVGKRMGSIKELKASLKKGTMGPIRYIPKNGSLTVRFLEEPENWVNYNEHWDDVRRLSYPCIENGCPGCASDARKSSRYLANALNVDDDKVIAIQLPKDLTNQLVRKYERNDTLMDRDYTLTRDGEGLETTYDADAEPVLNRKLTKYQLLDLEEVLDDVVQSVLGIDGDDEEPAPKKKGTAKRTARQIREAKVEDDEDEESAPVRRGAKKKFISPPARAEVDDDEDEDEDIEDDEDVEDEDLDEEDDEEAEDEDEEEQLTEADLEALTIGQLRTIAREEGIDVTGLKKADIIEELLASGDEEEDEDEDEEPF